MLKLLLYFSTVLFNHKCFVLLCKCYSGNFLAKLFVAANI